MSPDTTSRPADAAQSPTAQVIAVTELDASRQAIPRAAPSDGAAMSSRAEELGALNPLRNLRVQLTVCVGSAELTLGELLGARAQQVLRLERRVEEPVEVLLDGQVVARGTLVAVDDCFGVRITEVPKALELPLDAGASAGRVR